MIVFVALAILTGVEYLVGISQVPVVIMWLIALVKAGLVIWFFMHSSGLSGQREAINEHPFSIPPGRYTMAPL